MTPSTNQFKVWKYVLGVTIEPNNFAFEVKVILDLESTRSDGKEAKIRIYDPPY